MTTRQHTPRRRHTPLLLALVVGGAALVSPWTVEARGVQASVVAQIRTAASAAIADPAAKITVSDLRVSPAGLLERSRSVRGLELASRHRGFGRVAARATFVTRDGKTVQGFITAQVDATVEVLVATRRLRRGDALMEQDFRVERVSMGRARGALRADTVVDGLVAARDVMPGMVATDRAVTTPVLVRRGEPVTLVVAVGAVVVKATGTALRDGRRGERITVRAQEQRVVSGVVSGDREVRIER